MCLKESVSISINVAQAYNVNINTKETFSPLPGLEAVSQSHRQRLWLVWRRRQRRGHSFLQLELSPSGNTHGQKNPISRHNEFKLNTHTHTHKKSLILVRLAAMCGCLLALILVGVRYTSIIFYGINQKTHLFFESMTFQLCWLIVKCFLCCNIFKAF